MVVFVSPKGRVAVLNMDRYLDRASSLSGDPLRLESRALPRRRRMLYKLD